MKDYSYTELKEMQDRAMERVRAMQQRASETVSRENSLQAESRGSKASTDSNPASNFASANENSIIESILNDPDRAMLLPLLLLLKSEGANEELLMSLLYIMS